MDAEFKCSKFYVIQPICAFVFIGLFLISVLSQAFRVGQRNDEIVAWLLIACLLLYVIVRVVFRFIKVIKDPILFTIGHESIPLTYRKNGQDEIRWENIRKIESRPNRWAPGHEIIEIVFKNGTKKPLCDNFLKQYKTFKSALSKMASGKVETVKL